MKSLLSLILPRNTDQEASRRFLKGSRKGLGFSYDNLVILDEDTDVIRYVRKVTSGAPVHGVKANTVLTVAGTPTAGKTVTIGDIVYTWRATPGAEAYAVKINGTNGSASNLFLAITAGPLTGALEYGSATIEHPTHIASNDVAGQVLVTALDAGVAGNVAIAEDDAQTSWAGGITTMTLGVDCTVAALGEERFYTNKRYLATADMDITSTSGWVVSVTSTSL